MGVMVGDLAECYAKHADVLVRFAATQVGGDADDVVSAALLGVLQRGVDDVDDTCAYLYRAVGNASLKHWRGLGRRRRRDVVLVPRRRGTRSMGTIHGANGSSPPCAR